MERHITNEMGRNKRIVRIDSLSKSLTMHIEKWLKEEKERGNRIDLSDLASTLMTIILRINIVADVKDIHHIDSEEVKKIREELFFETGKGGHG